MAVLRRASGLWYETATAAGGRASRLTIVRFPLIFQGVGEGRVRHRKPRGTSHVAADSSTVAGIAGRYATALFDLARDSGQIDAIAADLGRIQGAIDSSADLRRLIISPVFDRNQQGRAMAAVLGALGIGQTVRNLAGLVARNRRLFAFSAIIRGYGELVARHRGEVTASVVSAQPLGAAQTEALAQALARAIGPNVRIETRVDPQLLGGLIVRVGSRQVDSSLRTKLANLSVAMKGVG